MQSKNGIQATLLLEADGERLFFSCFVFHKHFVFFFKVSEIGTGMGRTGAQTISSEFCEIDIYCG